MLETGKIVEHRMQNVNDCPRCKVRGKPEYFGSDPRCAFVGGVFNGDNWQCATANAIRAIIYDGHEADALTKFCGGWVFKSRKDDYSIGLVFTQKTGWTVLAWYKDRGQTDSIRSGEYGGSPLTLGRAEEIISEFESNGWPIPETEEDKAANEIITSALVATAFDIKGPHETE